MCRLIKKILIGSILFFYQVSFSYAQVETGETPVSLQLKSSFPDPPVIEMPQYDYEALRAKSLSDNNLKKLKYAQMIDVDISVREHAKTTRLANGTLYRVAIYSEKAYSLSLVFAAYRLPEGAKLFVYNKDRTHVKGAFTSRNNKSSGVFPVAPVKGEQVIIEYFEPDNRLFNGKLVLDEVGHDFLDIYAFNEKEAFEHMQVCDFDNWNINCSAGDEWQRVKQSVVMVVSSGNQCTASLINNVRSSGKPYLLTANHCINTQRAAERTNLFFNYESPTCEGNEGSLDQSMAGANLIATPPGDDQLDFALVELSNSIPVKYKPFFAGWSLDTNNIDSTVTIHHPEGAVKKITRDSDPPVSTSYPNIYDSDTHWLIQRWELGTTQPGSSGAPLFDQNKRLIGDLSGGQANCDNPVNDYFAKINRSWADFGKKEYQLKSWLDPDNGGFLRIDGYLPYDSLPSNLELHYSGASIQLNWNPPLNHDEVEYYQIIRNETLLDTTSVTSYKDTNVAIDSLYRYKISAYIDSSQTFTGYSEVASLLPSGVKSMPFSETFLQPDTLPGGWFEHHFGDTTNWSVKEGGYNSQPSQAIDGQYNLLFKGKDKDSSRIIMPLVDLSSSEYVLLKYFFAIPDSNGNTDQLNLYIRYADTLSWHLVKSYRNATSGWVSDSIYLPNPTGAYRVAFEGAGNNGGGVVLDDIRIYSDPRAFNPEFSVNEKRICTGDSVRFIANTSDSFDSYTWAFGYGASPRYAEGYGPHVVKYSVPGEKTVQLIIDSIYQTSSSQGVIIDTLPPKPNIEIHKDTLRASAKGDIRWFFEGNSIMGATNDIYVASEEGIYQVKITDQNGCSVFSDTVKYNGYTGVPDNAGTNELLRIYPVPSGESVQIAYHSQIAQEARLTVINALGSVVMKRKLYLSAGRNTTSVNIYDLPTGFYIVRLHPEDGKMVHSRLIKE